MYCWLLLQIYPCYLGLHMFFVNDLRCSWTVPPLALIFSAIPDSHAGSCSGARGGQEGREDQQPTPWATHVSGRLGQEWRHGGFLPAGGLVFAFFQGAWHYLPPIKCLKTISNVQWPSYGAFQLVLKLCELLLFMNWSNSLTHSRNMNFGVLSWTSSPELFWVTSELLNLRE